MGWFGALVGSSLGFFFAGPLGAIGGAALGHIFIDRGRTTPKVREKAGSRFSGYSTYNTQAGYFVALFSILGKIAASDGSVSDVERKVVQRFVDNSNLSADQRVFAIKIFEESINSPYSISDLAANFATLTAGMPTFRLNFVDILITIAAADGVIHPNEEKSIRIVAQHLSIDDAQLERLFRSRHATSGATGSHDPYQVLGCTPHSSDDEIRSSYRKMVSAYHPDKIISQELPEEFVELAHTRFREIQSAYTTIKKQRGIT